MIKTECNYWNKMCHYISSMDLLVNCNIMDFKIAKALQLAASWDQYQCGFLSPPSSNNAVNSWVLCAQTSVLKSFPLNSASVPLFN